MRRGGDESGQLLALAGVVLVLALVGAMLAVNELSSEQNQGQVDASSPLPERYRAARDEFVSTLTPLVFAAVDNNTLMTHFASISNETEQKARGNGYLMHVRLGNASDPFARKSEWNLTAPAGSTACPGGAARQYTGVGSFNGTKSYNTVNYDCTNDGIIWDGARSDAPIQGLVVYLFMSDHRSRIEETMVLGLN